ncbi:MAG: AtpZ/AtpI family protein [Anaerolineaceae bacterium]|jgi:F0F1-type ATP synthase assembly protein I|nr:AtpZ/AtpI family protein [Anaerolineaceae bacterium]
MDEHKKHDRKVPATSLFNATTAVVLGQVGFLTLVIILAAVGIGLFLDRRFETQPWITIILVLGSIPVSLTMTVLTVKRVLQRDGVEREPHETNNESE